MFMVPYEMHNNKQIMASFSRVNLDDAYFTFKLVLINVANFVNSSTIKNLQVFDVPFEADVVDVHN